MLNLIPEIKYWEFEQFFPFPINCNKTDHMIVTVCPVQLCASEMEEQWDPHIIPNLVYFINSLIISCNVFSSYSPSTLLPLTSPRSTPDLFNLSRRCIFFVFYNNPLNPACAAHILMSVEHGGPTRGCILKGNWLSDPNCLQLSIAHQFGIGAHSLSPNHGRMACSFLDPLQATRAAVRPEVQWGPGMSTRDCFILLFSDLWLFQPFCSFFFNVLDH